MKLPADLEGMLLFVKVVEHGSLSAAGRALGVPKATISRRLSGLEHRLGIQLVRRNTRSVTLTDAGAAYIRRCQPLIADAEAAELEVRARNADLSGQIRLTATSGFGRVVILPLVLEFMERHPAVRVDLYLTDRRVSVIQEGFDLAIRMGELETPTCCRGT